MFDNYFINEMLELEIDIYKQNKDRLYDRLIGSFNDPVLSTFRSFFIPNISFEKMVVI